MKKRFPLSSITLMMIFLSSSIAFGLDLKAGVKCGCTFPWFSGSGYQTLLDTSPPWQRVLRLGISGGASLSVGLSESLEIQPEVFFSQLGGNATSNGVTWSESVNGFDLQVFLKAKFQSHGGTLISAFIGPDLFIKNGQEEIQISNGYQTITSTYKDMFVNASRSGIVCGLGLEIPMGSFFWTIDGRYSISFTPRFTAESGLGPWYQNSVQLMVGIEWVLAGEKPRRVQ